MNIKKKKEELVKQFNFINQKINELLALREQIRGKLMLIQEQEKQKEKKKK